MTEELVRKRVCGGTTIHLLEPVAADDVGCRAPAVCGASHHWTANLRTSGSLRPSRLCPDCEKLARLRAAPKGNP